MAYPFVRLHQPSAAYGVNSRQLGNDGIDLTGWNKGLYELATAGEVCAYFDAVMQQQLLPTGRVSYFPMSEYQGDRRFRTFAGDSYEVNVKRRVVDTTYTSGHGELVAAVVSRRIRNVGKSHRRLGVEGASRIYKKRVCRFQLLP